MAVKSEIVRPFAGEALGLGKQRVFGLAWAGEEAVARVELSTDGGQTWREAELLGPFAPYSWTMWEYLWDVADGRLAIDSCRGPLPPAAACSRRSTTRCSAAT